MAIIKKHEKQELDHFPQLDNLEEATDFLHNAESEAERDYAVDEIVKLHGGAKYLIESINDDEADPQYATKVASAISNLDPDDAPIEEVMELLKLSNAYIRNLGISILRNFGDSIKYYIVKFLIGDDRDLRIFAINVLGDVNFAESRDMLVELLEHEEDINVAMTAVDYMGEIGEEEDIPLLESLKERFAGDFYAEFAVDGAIKMIKG